MNAILLRAHDASLNTETPRDKFMFIKEVALDANGQAVIDMRKELRAGAKVNYFLLSNTTTYAATSAATFGTAGIAMNKGGLGISTVAVAASGDEPAVVIPAASKTVIALIFVDPTDLVQYGD